MSRALISAAELKDIMDAPDVKILDASYNLPPAPGRIGRALDFDIDAVADIGAAYPHTVPKPGDFGDIVGEMGIGSGQRIVVYDRAGLSMAAARAWWMFRLFGHDNVRILDGGLPAWLKAGYPLAAPAGDDDPASDALFRENYRPELIRRKQDILDNLTGRKFTVVDARDARRYSGDAPEPRPGVEGGHIPGAINVPYAGLIDPATGLFKKKEDLKAALGQVDPGKPVVVSCGSGVTACVVALALFETGNENAAVYGGSWAEWGSDPAVPKTRGGAP
jgi:thiosulfate/3-mercaptopyruvate sulfurtransferase